MSTTYHAAAIIGCRIPRSKIFLKKKIRTCEHTLSEGNPKFCQECGKRIHLTIDSAIDEYNSDNNTIGGLGVFGNNFSDQVLLAADAAVVDCEEWISDMISINPSSHNRLKQKIKSILEPLDLWDEEQFGVWGMIWTS